METTAHRPALRSGRAQNALRALTGLLPLWMVVLAVSAEGFPPPLVSPKAAIALMIGAVALSVLLLAAGWMRVGLALYSLTPIYFLMVLDEITNQYKLPFLLALGAALTAGALIAMSLRRRRWSWQGLVVSAGVCILLAQYAGQNFWELQEALGVSRCFLDYTGCPPLPADAPAWWQVFLGIF